VACPADIATNFFLVPESLGQKAAKEACALLGELNTSVSGEWKDEVSNHSRYRVYPVTHGR
jgi:hypothetical protein